MLPIPEDRVFYYHALRGQFFSFISCLSLTYSYPLLAFYKTWGNLSQHFRSYTSERFPLKSSTSVGIGEVLLRTTGRVINQRGCTIHNRVE
jgi:hypothetical protein